MGAFNQLNGAMLDAPQIEVRINALDGLGIYNQRMGSAPDMDRLARRLTALDGKVTKFQGGTEFDVDDFMRRLAAIEAGLFTPALLFATASKGFWYDPSDFSTMFQDSAGTIPPAVGQPVGKILDKSGNGNHATQATAANRPTLQVDGSGHYYLAFNGTNSCLVTASTDFTGTAQMSVFAGVRKLSDAAVGVIAELSAAAPSNLGSFYLIGPDTTSSPKFQQALNGTAVASVTSTASFSAPISAVITSQFSISGPTNILRINGSVNAQSATSVGTGNFGNYAINIGARSAAATPSLFFNGNLYGLCVVGKAASAGETASTESYLNGKTGAY